jgi:hypothetical protein
MSYVHKGLANTWLFNNTFTCCKESTVWVTVNDKLEKTWKEADVALSKVLQQHVNQGEKDENFSQDSWFPGWDVTLECSEYEFILFICNLYMGMKLGLWH